MRKIALSTLFLMLPILAACSYYEKRPSTITLNDGKEIVCPGGLLFNSESERVACYNEGGKVLLIVGWENVKGYTVE
ncbi:MAG: hypothetical protein A2651_01080 [Candidatus Yanofskybacteria bacterium RIFCSPHIGHO2_01_FULL_42_12]|uniref:Lipoprotein n=1 Tax=Candidatus Yanofskybacteria bacterium RIFCSPLOWO2_01_FULL_42_49 TaxID=1802694 RepID=A0A1F8GD34_9BACT|nr:MAG: hypothetical protein A2651_01080 [Candidatus Yanofskybacteria bacterium RIFCSPHIGHO2_01_FULL_42_12]OGN22658.1 MAG: hypothetical protein A2918_00970 [Candidatus Yanofskybacteria bacterium RIFCSPLOWO2_01_FULL_42_49]